MLKTRKLATVSIVVLVLVVDQIWRGNGSWVLVIGVTVVCIAVNSVFERIVGWLTSFPQGSEQPRDSSDSHGPGEQ